MFFKDNQKQLQTEIKQDNKKDGLRLTCRGHASIEMEALSTKQWIFADLIKMEKIWQGHVTTAL